MIRGIYLSASGMLTNLERQDVVTHNLANMSNYGFRRSVAVERANESAMVRRFSDHFLVTPKGIEDKAPAIGWVGRGVILDETAVDMTQGQTVETGNPWDLMVRGGGFFAVQTPQGVALTRQGNFALDQDGRLVNGDGFSVLGVNGEILLHEGARLEVAADGIISADGLVEDELLILRPGEGAAIRPRAGNLLMVEPGDLVQAGDGEFEVSQGHLESSNVSAVGEMVSMIQLLRAYEANQKMIQYQDETLDKAVNELGVIR